MSGSSPSRSDPPPSPDITQLLAVVEALRQQNEVLQDSIQVLQTQSLQDGDTEEDPLDSQPLSEAIWNDQVPENFKPPSLVPFNGKTDQQEHIIAINNQMLVVGAFDSLKCKIMARTFKEGALRWCMIPSQFLIISYQVLTKKMVQYFSASKHRKVSTTSLFSIRQKHAESLREYMVRFNKETIKVSYPNQEMLVGAFQHDLKSEQFNESLAQKPAPNMDEVIT